LSPAKIAPVRPSIARFLKRGIGEFLREFDRELHQPPPSAAPPKPEQTVDAPATPAEEAEGAAPSGPARP
jgi:hypothetical protein